MKKKKSELNFDNQEDLKTYIQNVILTKNYIHDINSGLHQKNFYKKTGNILEFISQVLFYSSMVSSFASIGFDVRWLDFLTSILIVVCKAIGHLAFYFQKESIERIQLVNTILDHLDIKGIPITQINTSLPGEPENFELINSPSPPNKNYSNSSLEISNSNSNLNNTHSNLQVSNSTLSLPLIDRFKVSYI